MANKNPDVTMCHKRTGPDVGMLCEICEGRCPLCDSRALSTTPVRVCGECAFGPNKDRCILCGNPAKYTAYYCRECVLLGKDRDGCPRIINSGLSRNDRAYERKRIVVVQESPY